MAKVKIQGNASGTGVVTLTAPNTNADRTITLPDGTGELIQADSSGRVGIGTSSPVSPLHVNSGATNVSATFESTDATSAIALKDSSGNVELSTSGGGFDVQPGGGASVMRIDSAGRVTMPYQPAFHAHGINNITTKPANMIYPTISSGADGMNIGNHYSTTTGKFTAPIAGIYQFGFGNIGSNEASVKRAYLRVNGASLNDLHLRQDGSATGSEYQSNGMLTVTLSLAANDVVNTVATAGTFYHEGGLASNGYYRFCGHLIG